MVENTKGYTMVYVWKWQNNYQSHNFDFIQAVKGNNVFQWGLLVWLEIGAFTYPNPMG